MDVVAQLNSVLAGRYAIEREIGAGGMATVYLARDLKHDRHVALKVLKPELGAVLGVERFLSEIRVTANLQHPNLLPLFDSGEANGLLFYVMPFVEGETLRARLEREKQLPVNEATRIASAVASALEYAHSHNVIHRDLKPENILLQGGQPVIADFGIALAVSNAGGQRVTQTGLSLGTPQYMSPEQATGDRQIDARTDIYSLAAVTFEMLVGDPPHLGSTAQAIIAKVLTERPPSVRVSRPSVPDYTAYAIDKGLEKLPADRWRTAAEFDAALTGRSGPVEVPGSYQTSARSSAAPAGRFSRALAKPVVAAALGVIAIVCAAGWWVTARRVAEPAGIRLTIERPPTGRIEVAGDAIAISPDGRTVAYIGLATDVKRQLYVRSLDDVAPRALAGAENANAPFFSPDSKWVAFFADQQLKKIALTGGSAVPLADIPSPYGGSWGKSGVIAVSSRGRIILVPENGGTPHPAPGADSASGRASRWPVFLDDGETVLYTTWNGSVSDAKIAARSIKTGVVADVGVVGATAVGVFDGFVVYTNGAGALLAAPFNARTLRATGDAEQILDGVATGGNTDRPPMAISSAGALVYQFGSLLREAVMVDAQGTARRITPDEKSFQEPRFSPDGKWAAFSIAARGSVDIWVYDLTTGSSAKLTVAGTANTRPEWSSDSKRVLYRSNRDGTSSMWWQPIDGSAPAEKLLSAAGQDVWEGVLSPDDHTVLFRTGTSGSADLWFRGLSGDTATKPFAASQFTEYEGRFSPDGKWVAFSSDELGARQVFVRPFPSGGGRFQVSTNGGIQPVWSRDGKRIFYVRGPQLMSARVSTSPAFAVISRDTVKGGQGFFSTGHAGYDIAADGEHALIIREATTDVPTIVITNWLGEWRAQRAAAKRR